jgi:hypothetical protein
MNTGSSTLSAMAFRSGSEGLGRCERPSVRHPEGRSASAGRCCSLRAAMAALRPAAIWARSWRFRPPRNSARQTGPRLDLTKNVKRWCRERHARPDLWFMLLRALNHPSMAAATRCGVFSSAHIALSVVHTCGDVVADGPF